MVEKDKDFVMSKEDQTINYIDKYNKKINKSKKSKKSKNFNPVIIFLIIMLLISYGGIYYLYNKLSLVETSIIGENNKEKIFNDYQKSSISQKSVLEQIATLNNTAGDLQKVLNIKSDEIDKNFNSLKEVKKMITILDQITDRLERTNAKLGRITDNVVQEQQNTKAYVSNIEDRMQKNLIKAEANNNEIIEKQKINTKQIIVTKSNLTKIDDSLSQVLKNINDIKNSASSFRRQNNNRVLTLESDILSLQKKLNSINDKLNILSTASGIN